MQLVDPTELYFPPDGIVVRAGIIPYMIKDGLKHYLIGLDSRGFYTDMGGGCKESRQERPIDCLIREVREETDPTTAIKVIMDLYISRIEVYRETRETFADYGYPFIQRRPGPVHRYCILVELIPPLNNLGGLTGKKEVYRYDWMTREEISRLNKDSINQACYDFFASLKE